MTSNVHKQCAVCAWRENCAKKHTIGESSPRCPDFCRDARLGADSEPERARERHKQVDDVFGDS